ncbi:hypothetical protein SOMG_03359 [Schizosaccharomyces osmophilus]|uniref:Uncharacterized protein n=1 Tax=Schizosaccharomyces osmophilus TaxID=2545709 RepID=A0AAE9WD84_9SCHI|nr:uncharacterized protein SOMG_03359 [Schizosaccharomyces osmophilus]WBW73723.1 hypothetical protein SOMG_03359 [Schizosaccharomyces osmophilus]
MSQPSFPIDHDLRQELMEHLVNVLHQRCKQIPASQLYVLAFSFDRFAQIKSITLQMYIQHYQEKFKSYHSALPHMALSYGCSSFPQNASYQSFNSPITDSFATSRSISTPPPSSSSSSSSCTPNNLDIRSPSSFTETQSKPGPFVSHPLSFSSSFQDSSSDFGFMNPSLQAHTSFFPTHLSNPHPPESFHDENSGYFYKNEVCNVPFNSNDKDHHLFFLNDNDLTFPSESVYPSSAFLQNEDLGSFFPTP